MYHVAHLEEPGLATGGAGTELVLKPQHKLVCESPFCGAPGFCSVSGAEGARAGPLRRLQVPAGRGGLDGLLAAGRRQRAAGRRCWALCNSFRFDLRTARRGTQHPRNSAHFVARLSARLEHTKATNS